MGLTSGIVNKDIAAVSNECKAYVDDLLRSEKLPPRGLNWDWYRNFEDSAYGVVFWVTEDYRSQFNEVYRYLIDARTKALENQYSTRAQELLKIVESDGQKFLEQVCITHSGNNQYARIPILAAIDPEEFVASWMKSPKENWYWIRNALQERYKFLRDGELKAEASWIKTVVRLLEDEAAKTSGFAKVRIQRAIPNLPDELLNS